MEFDTSSVHYERELLGHSIRDSREGPLNPGNRDFFHPEKTVSGPHRRVENADTDLLLLHSHEDSYSIEEGNLRECLVTEEVWEGVNLAAERHATEEEF